MRALYISAQRSAVGVRSAASASVERGVYSCNMNVLQVVQRLRLLCRRLAVVLLWIAIFGGMAAAERTCGSDFDDVGSSSMLAPIVVEGRAKRVLYQTGEPNGTEGSSAGVSAVFDRLRLYKGQLMHNLSSIEVGYFGIRADREACVAPLPVVRRWYVLFVRQDDGQTDAASTNVNSVEDDTRRRRELYRLTAFPVRKSHRNIATVLEYTNCTRCGTQHMLVITSNWHQNFHVATFSTRYVLLPSSLHPLIPLVPSLGQTLRVKRTHWPVLWNVGMYTCLFFFV